jgi:acyl-CoA thioesterase YciA
MTETHTRTIAIRRLLLPRDTNHRGEVFGGAILAEIDLAGAVEARRHTKHDVATVAVKEVQFKQPVHVGDVVTFYTSTIKIGTSSIHVRVEVEASRDGEAAPHSVTAAELVYVAVRRNEDGTIEKVPVQEQVNG